jgi:hypothetical protein
VKENSESDFSVLQTVTTQKGARTITLNKSTHQLYLSTAEYGAKPEPTSENPKPRPGLIPNSFKILVVEDVR